ncbi:MAG TPA: aspartyl protease family protein [Rhizomicrobium sp.]|nr:aspartyl protease family protein [Rhizomicrobium sp.]
MKRALIFLAMALAGGAPSAHAVDCRALKLASFDIDYAATRAPVTIDGRDYAFLVDTGGYVSTISPAIVEALNLKPAPIETGGEIYMADGTVIDQVVTVNEVQVGLSKTNAVRFAVQPETSRAGMQFFQGTLAPDFLKKFDLDFDFGNRKLNLMSPEHCAGNVAYWSSSAIAVPFRTDAANHIIVPVKLDGVQTTAVVDTGASHTAMSELMASRAFNLTPDRGLTRILGASDHSLVQYEHRFKVLALNGVEFDDLTIAILPDDMAKSVAKNYKFKMADQRPTGPVMNAYPIIIGIDQLRKTHLYVDYKNETLYITAASAPVDAQAEAP